MIQGIIVKSTGLWYHVRTEAGDDVQCRIVGKFRLNGFALTNPVAVGDQVQIEMEPDKETGFIKNILPRKNYVVRQSPHRKHDLHLLASNVDAAIVVVTIVHPNLKPGFIDRFLLMTEPYDIPTHIVFNKADLYREGDLNIFEYMRAAYESIGYKVHLVSSVNQTGLEEIRTVIKGGITLVSGQSGVGKSTFVNALQPNLGLKTQEISDYSGKGQHTTTFAEMFDMDFGGAIIDTPGIKTLSFNHFGPMDVAHNFREFFEISDDCKFGGSCLHRNEPGCAVKEALENEEISPLRYENYLAILDEVENIKHWERNKDY